MRQKRPISKGRPNFSPSHHEAAPEARTSPLPNDARTSCSNKHSIAAICCQGTRVFEPKIVWSTCVSSSSSGRFDFVRASVKKVSIVFSACRSCLTPPAMASSGPTRTENWHSWTIPWVHFCASCSFRGQEHLFAYSFSPMPLPRHHQHQYSFEERE